MKAIRSILSLIVYISRNNSILIEYLSSFLACTENAPDNSGKFGVVRRCVEIKTKKPLAAKYIQTQNAQDRKDVEREVDIMRSLQHPRLLQLYDAFDSGAKQMVLIMEL